MPLEVEATEASETSTREGVALEAGAACGHVSCATRSTSSRTAPVTASTRTLRRTTGPEVLDTTTSHARRSEPSAISWYPRRGSSASRTGSARRSSSGSSKTTVRAGNARAASRPTSLSNRLGAHGIEGGRRGSGSASGSGLEARSGSGDEPVARHGRAGGGVEDLEAVHVLRQGHERDARPRVQVDGDGAKVLEVGAGEPGIRRRRAEVVASGADGGEFLGRERRREDEGGEQQAHGRYRGTGGRYVSASSRTRSGRHGWVRSYEVTGIRPRGRLPHAREPEALGRRPPEVLAHALEAGSALEPF